MLIIQKSLRENPFFFGNQIKINQIELHLVHARAFFCLFVAAVFVFLIQVL